MMLERLARRLGVAVLAATPAPAEEAATPAGRASTLELAKKAQNPIADLISLPVPPLSLGDTGRSPINLSTPPIITLDWEADGNDSKLTVSGGGCLLRVDRLPVNLQGQTFYKAVKPDEAPAAAWSVRLQAQLLPPK